MLTRFRVANFKSFQRAEFVPMGLNLIVGTNNAGKTNLCQAMLFTGLSSSMALDDAAKACTPEPWNLLNVYTASDTVELEVEATLLSEGEELRFSYRLAVSGRKAQVSGKQVIRPFRVEYESLTVSGGDFKGTVLLENKAGSVRLLHEKRYLQTTGQVISTEDQAATGWAFVETSAPTEATMLYRLYDLETNRRANLFKRYLSSWTYYNFDALRLRSSAATAMDRKLKADGSNLCSVLYTLHNERPREEKKLVESVRLLEPRLDLISFQSPDPEHVYMFFEDKEGHRFGVQNISDGTLRFIAMSYLVPLIMLEEPENGIYVGHLKPLFQKIEPSGVDGQFAFTSHNPYFIDLFDSLPEGLHVIRTVGNESKVGKPDPEKIRRQLGSFSVGDMHFRGLLV